MICPICETSTSKILTDKLRGGKKGKVLYCPRCDLGMLETYRTSQSLKQYYDKNYRKEHKPVLTKVLSPGEIFEIESPLQQYRVGFIKKRLKKDARVLDVGCSAGMFLAGIKPYVSKAWGIDYDSRSARFASKKTGFKVYATDIENTGIPENSLDMISMFQTLEHVDNPFKILKRLSRYLKPSGIFYIEVPNLHDALLHAFDLRNYFENHWFHDAHLWYFSGKSLKKLMAKLGFTCDLRFYQDYNLINHMNWILNDRPQKTAKLGRSAPQLPFRESLAPQKKNALKKFIDNADREYKQLLEKLGLAANLLFIAKRK